MFPIWSILEPDTQVVLVLEAAYIYIHTYMNRFMYTKLDTLTHVYICIYVYVHTFHTIYYILYVICLFFTMY